MGLLSTQLHPETTQRDHHVDHARLSEVESSLKTHDRQSLSITAHSMIHPRKVIAIIMRLFTSVRPTSM